MTKIYLAIPYSFNPELSFKIANRITADLMSKGNIVFSPISHSHPVADYLPSKLRTDSDWWMNMDLPFVNWADDVYVVCIGEMGSELIANSKGVCMELQFAKQLNKTIHIIDYYHDESGNSSIKYRLEV